MSDAKRITYSMIVEWEPRDQIFVVTVPELPGCSTHGASYEEAVRQGQDAIEGWIETNQLLGRPVPPPRHMIIPDEDLEGWDDLDEDADVAAPDRVAVG